MIRQLGRVVAAELSKLRTLPAVPITGLGTTGAAVVLAAAFAAAEAPAAAAAPDRDVVSITLQAVPLLQVGFILLGVLVIATEYPGSQLRVTLTAIPNRSLGLAGKTVAYLVVAALTSFATLTAGLLGAWATRALLTDAPLPVEASLRPIPGAATYLVLIGLIGYASAILLRSLLFPLVAMLSLVLIASPLLAEVTALARWLPDRAGQLLYLPAASADPTWWSGALVLLAWIAAAGAGAAVSFLTRDA